MRKLVIFGDSIMKGVINDEGKYRFCDDHNFKELEDKQIQVINASKMGATVASAMPILEKKLPEFDRDTTVLFSFGGNDCDYDWQAVSEHPTAEHLPHLPEREFISSYVDAIRAAQKSGAQVVLNSLVPLDENRFFAHISKDRSAENILSWLGDVNHLYRWQEYYNSLVCSLARSFGCRMIDLRQKFLQVADFRTLLSDDGIHPSQKGHTLIHKSIASVI